MKRLPKHGLSPRAAAMTAKRRSEPSSPMAWLHASGKLVGRCLDYGCGRGDDVRFMRQLGVDIVGFDPMWGPLELPRQVDTVTCLYVLNVLAREPERDRVIERVRSVLAPGGRAYFAVRRDIDDDDPLQHDVRLSLQTIWVTPRCEIYEWTGNES